MRLPASLTALVLALLFPIASLSMIAGVALRVPVMLAIPARAVRHGGHR